VCVSSWTELRRAVSRVAGWTVRDVASVPIAIVCRFVLDADEGTCWKEELILQQLRCTHVRSRDCRSVSLSETLKRISEVKLRNSSV